MRIILTDWYGDWKGAGSARLRPVMLDLRQGRHLTALIVSLGNGDLDEACIEVDSTEAYEYMKSALPGTGGAHRIEPTSRVRSCRLFRAGYEVYSRADDSCFFLNPTPRLDLFSPIVDLAAYASEFSALEG